MNHYQKLATALVRGAGAAMVALGLFGIVLFLLGRPVGRLIGRGLE
jgi:hypothetical protein